MPMYNPAKWYWKIGGSTASEAWSSASMSFVSTVTDATYLAWIAAGNNPTTTDAASLAALMLDQGLPMLMAAGVPLISTGTPALNGTYALGTSTLNTITGLATKLAAGRSLPGGGETFNYADTSGVFHAFSAANFLNFADAIVDFIYNFGQAIGVVIAGGSATLPPLSLTIA